jgi:hypothetical protein
MLPGAPVRCVPLRLKLFDVEGPLPGWYVKAESEAGETYNVGVVPPSVVVTEITLELSLWLLPFRALTL